MKKTPTTQRTPRAFIAIRPEAHKRLKALAEREGVQIGRLVENMTEARVRSRAP